MSERELNSQEIMNDQNHSKPLLENLWWFFAIKQILGINSSESWYKKPHLWFKYVSVYCSLGKIMTYTSLLHKSSHTQGEEIIQGHWYQKVVIIWNYFKRCLQLVKNPPAMRDTWVQSLVGKIPWRRERLPTPVFWPLESHGLYSPWGRKGLDMTERLSLLQIFFRMALKWFYSLFTHLQLELCWQILR